MAMTKSAAQTAADGLLVAVRLGPGASRDQVAGLVERDRSRLLKVQVRAKAEKGRANAALVALMAKWLGVPKSTITLKSGATGRQKRLHVAGDPDILKELFETAVAHLEA